MGLDLVDRGALEKIIAHAIETIPDLMPSIRNTISKTKFQISNPEEFCYGFTHGKIFAEFAAYYADKYRSMPNPDMVEEIRNVLEKRSRDIKDAIFNCG